MALASGGGPDLQVLLLRFWDCRSPVVREHVLDHRNRAKYDGVREHILDRKDKVKYDGCLGSSNSLISFDALAGSWENCRPYKAA